MTFTTIELTYKNRPLVINVSCVGAKGNVYIEVGGEFIEFVIKNVILRNKLTKDYLISLNNNFFYLDIDKLHSVLWDNAKDFQDRENVRILVDVLNVDDICRQYQYVGDMAKLYALRRRADIYVQDPVKAIALLDRIQKRHFPSARPLEVAFFNEGKMFYQQKWVERLSDTST